MPKRWEKFRKKHFGETPEARSSRYLVLATALLVASTAALVAVNWKFISETKSAQKSANSTAVALATRAARSAAQAEVTVGADTAIVYAARVEQALTGLLHAAWSGDELQPFIVFADLNLTVSDGVALLHTSAARQVIRDLGAFTGQMRVTYTNFRPATGHHHPLLRHIDVVRVCRTIGFAHQVEDDVASVPGAAVKLSSREYVPRRCAKYLTKEGLVLSSHA